MRRSIAWQSNGRVRVGFRALEHAGVAQVIGGPGDHGFGRYFVGTVRQVGHGRFFVDRNT